MIFYSTVANFSHSLSTMFTLGSFPTIRWNIKGQLGSCFTKLHRDFVYYTQENYLAKNTGFVLVMITASRVFARLPVLICNFMNKLVVIKPSGSTLQESLQSENAASECDKSLANKNNSSISERTFSRNCEGEVERFREKLQSSEFREISESPNEFGTGSMSVKLYSKEHSGNQFEMLRTKRVVSKNETHFFALFLEFQRVSSKGSGKSFNQSSEFREMCCLKFNAGWCKVTIMLLINRHFVIFKMRVL